jgi:hypothetical protein
VPVKQPAAIGRVGFEAVGKKEAGKQQPASRA